MPITNRPRKGAFKPRLIKDKKKRNMIKSKIIEALNDGIDVKEAFLLAGIPAYTYYDWKNQFANDLEHDYPPTYFMEFMMDIAKADVNFHRSIRKELVKKAQEGDVRALMYLEDNRFGMANKRKQLIDFGTKEDANIEINIVNMTSVENDETEAIEVDFDEVEHRNDSNSTEMD